LETAKTSQKDCMDPTSAVTQSEWQRALTGNQRKAAQLFGRTEAEQKQRGYFHTLKEICQQPWTWTRTSERMAGLRDRLLKSMSGIKSLVFTGSGSSEYAGDCVRLPLQNELALCVESVSGGNLLVHGAKALPKDRPGLLVSLARSGNSPESTGTVRILLESEPAFRHLIVTCNEAGSLAKTWHDHEGVLVVALPPETNDESLVMTSSFTNLTLAARFLGLLDQPEAYRKLCAIQSRICRELVGTHFDVLSRIASTEFRRAVFLGSGTRYSAAREASLKMLEMTSGRVTTISESFLGLRHGPMSFVHEDTLVVCQLSSDPTTRAYELDLLAELDRKKLGLSKVIIGEDVPESAARAGDEVIQSPGLGELGDDDGAIIFVVVAQLLAFFRCLEEGLRPDSPSEGGVISRVVESFPLHTLP
jgi:tagatose-6-phosphate ketose/aldose isomerase